ncbi:Serine/threonine-protein kinase SIK3 [Gossypium arboreum]|uniref:Serine/threonine-protein kinase SIK3 n=1 Tax=Gossypium arboreum TaxID=29729 RepID=A0A0B0NNV2_GOSAR|nr:Serine/threonine-protein kinase SIK3 [Gossypium arboreum]
MYKLAANDGMSLRESLKKVNRKVLLQAFLCGLFRGSLVQNLYLQSLVHTSATFAVAKDGETGNKNKCRESQSVWDINRNKRSNGIHILQRINTRSFVCSSYCEGLESMEAWVEC